MSPILPGSSCVPSAPSRRSFVALSALVGVGVPVLAGCDLPGVSKDKGGSASPWACPVFCVSVLQVGVDSVGVGGGELGQGLVPVGGDLSFDESALGLALGWWQSFLLVAFSGSFVLDVADR